MGEYSAVFMASFNQPIYLNDQKLKQNKNKNIK